MERLSNSSRASFYKNTADFQPKLYLDCVNILKFRSAMARLRVSSHRLEIEAGNWSRPYKPVNKRKRKLCNCLEDEFHFVIECDLYCILRRKYINAYYWRRPIMMKFIELVNSTNNVVIWLVGCFGFNGPLRQYFSLYRVVSQRGRKKREKIDERKNVQTSPTRTHCKRNRPLPYYNPNE